MNALLWPVLLFASFAHANIISNSADLFELRRADIDGKDPAQIHYENTQTIAKFFAMDVDDRDRVVDLKKAKYLRYSDAQSVYYSAQNNPVVSLNEYNRYDPYNQGIGFCFGRAMFVHLELVYRGLDRDSIKKAFVMGPMSKSAWGWHVTTIAQTKNQEGKEEWQAIDPILEEVMTLSDWYNYWRINASDDGRLKLYITENTRFGANAIWYDDREINHSFYNSYFRDLMSWFEYQSITGAYSTPLTEM